MPFTHTPHLPLLLWTLFTLPLTIWDTAYILLRPHSFPGGKWHAPFFLSMEPWASTDHLYGPEAWGASEGFTAAQAVVNVLEVGMYTGYVWGVWRGGGLGGGARWRIGKRRIQGKMAAGAVVLGFAAGVVTATKTGLYCRFFFSLRAWCCFCFLLLMRVVMREVFSGYVYTGHNELHPLLTLWGFMNALYFLASGYMIGAFGTEIYRGLLAGEGDKED
ncbi:uncharacterized protein K460DRAFT_392277 [Cucurbitaria berberidis CBS 394.84]|uniref:Uncharacterized protein n=1 Tax=Cucurbitaria berberidis CBS 394.84 TaxID=1168544 RepID=A0A9P4GSW7_9PLEO|nr:uncharacterized protein K460DRAFT_392277 [Cucurbitaria berberidis CBS 394.84]KAF1852153.1 hypothetical protein K460DRAFT_392277 [Cucurbitaria berberidis CBS 394.84]